MKRKLLNAGTSVGVKKAWEVRKAGALSSLEKLPRLPDEKNWTHSIFKSGDHAAPYDTEELRRRLRGPKTVKTVNLDDLTGTNEFFEPKVKDIIERGDDSRKASEPSDDQLDKPVVVQKGGKQYIADGNHRLTARKLLGDKTADVYHVNMDEKVKNFAIPLPLAIKNTASALLKAKASPKTIRATLHGLLNAYLPKTVSPKPQFELLNAVIGRWKANPVVVVANGGVGSGLKGHVTDRPTMIGRLNAIKSEIMPLAQKGGLTASEASRFIALNAEANSLRYDLARPKTIEDIKSPADRKSAIPSSVVLTARNDLMKNRDVYNAITEAAIGVGMGTNTAVDNIMDGRNSRVSASELYDCFTPTRNELRSNFGDSMTLYRSEGLQKQKATKNWATTKSGAEQYGGNIITKSIPVDDIVAVNVGLTGTYEEVIVGKRPELKITNALPHKGLGRVPTPKQSKAGNYRQTHTTYKTLGISIESLAGSVRSGIGKDGKVWTVVMPSDYGGVKGTKKGTQDGDLLDCYLSTNPSDTASVFVIDQVDAETGNPDERKCMIGFQDEKQATDCYKRAFSDGRGHERIGAVTKLDFGQFEQWIKGGDLSKPVAGQFPKPVVKLANSRTRKAALKKRLLNSFEGHEGRVGQVGGSLPKGESSPHPITWDDVKENLDRESRFSRGRKSDDQIHLETLADFENKPAGDHVLKLANDLNDEVHKLMGDIPFNQKDLTRRLVTSQALFDDNPDGVWPVPVYISAKNDPNTVGLLLSKDGKKEMFEGNDEATPETMDLVNEAMGIGDKQVRVYTSQPSDVISKIKAGEYPEGIFVSPDKSHAASYWGEGRDLTSFKIPIKHLAQHSEVDWQIRPHKA
jgi:hypothetical protein